jgi:hypothetical protein
MKTRHKIYDTVTLNIIDNFEGKLRLPVFRQVRVPVNAQMVQTHKHLVRTYLNGIHRDR